ncbi:GNAT family N-acetyltransferase [Desulfosporosinus sp. OT]|uniref:GNAT family N-acetyltransferase n=1 Tax=Desulfosporosinus sp. OT TaxID=913865 RepID=UPI0002239AD0|nr:GNAT family N-acetyltransferase [Desulfosporosinus sp. OT]EGW41586.1 acetyltransferase family protein [Desulfosporosinus sp. OT]
MKKNIRVNTLEHISLHELTDIWNRCWRGYYYDMTYTPEHMRVWLHLSQVSLQHSMAILVEDQIVGFALLSIDGVDGWIAGACLDPNYRGKGLFAPLMFSQLNSASCVGLKGVFLEVLEQNHALKVYQSVGFTRMRQLNIYRTQGGIDFFSDGKVEACHLEMASVEQYFESRRRAFFNPAWQRREEYLKRYGNFSAVMNSSRTAGALFAGDKNAPCLDAWSATESGAKELISSVLGRSNASFSLTNQPEDWIVSFLSAYGINPNAKQFEMHIKLA